MTIRRLFSEKLPPEPRERFGAAAALGFAPLFTACQCHGDHVVVLDEAYRYPGLEALIANQPEGDAIVTSQKGLYIGVKTADCVPVLLWDEVAGVVAAVHAGWRGTAAGVVTKALTRMCEDFGATRENLQAAIGPCVCVRCYETDGEVPAAMPQEARPFIHGPDGGKYHVDLPGINACYLRKAGIERVEMPKACTACEPGRYWSHRRHGTNRGLQLSMIGLSP